MINETNCKEVQRLRDMGVSFIRKEDLFPVPEDRKNRKPEVDEASGWYYPKTVASTTKTPNTSEYSLMINSAALKYLNEAQLAHIALKSPQNNQTGSGSRNQPVPDANVTRFGLPEDNVSQATYEFLTKNRLEQNKNE